MKHEIIKFYAILSLVGCSLSQNADGIHYHDGQTPPTEAEIDAELKRLQEEWDAQAYAINRKAEYDALNQF